MNLDLGEDINKIYFIFLKTYADDIFSTKKYVNDNNHEKYLALLKHSAEIYDCILINQSQISYEYSSFFVLDDHKNALNSNNFDVLQEYIRTKARDVNILNDNINKNK